MTPRRESARARAEAVLHLTSETVTVVSVALLARLLSSLPRVGHRSSKILLLGRIDSRKVVRHRALTGSTGWPTIP